MGLALYLRAELLLIDERLGREAAKSLSVRTAGVLGTLLVAKQKGLIAAVHPILRSLVQQAGFRVSNTLYEYVLHQAGEEP